MITHKASRMAHLFANKKVTLNMLKTSFYCSVVLILMVGCASQAHHASTERDQGIEAPKSLQELTFGTAKKSLRSISGKGKLSSEIGSNAITLTFDVEVLGQDSLLMNFQAFGLPLGTLQATPDYFVFYSILENRIYRGKPTRDNIARTIRVPLSYEEMSTLFLGNIPGGNQDFSFYEVSVADEESPTLLYVRADEEFVERVGLTADGKNLVEYSRKVPAGSTLMVSRFSEFSAENGHDLAKRIAASFPAYDATVTISFDEITCNQRAEKYWFALPQDAAVLELK